MVIANPPLAEPVIDPRGVTIKPPFEMGVANFDPAWKKEKCCCGGYSKGAGMLCMGDDDRQYRDENGVKVQHGQMPVKGALHRLRGRPLTAIRLCCKG